MSNTFQYALMSVLGKHGEIAESIRTANVSVESQRRAEGHGICSTELVFGMKMIVFFDHTHTTSLYFTLPHRSCWPPDGLLVTPDGLLVDS